MSNAAALQALEYEAETTFGEDVTTFATHRIPIVGPITLDGIKHDKIPSDRVVQRLQEGTPHILGPMEGSFKMKLWWHGHGTTTVGSPTVDAIETFLAYVFGNPTSNGLLSAAASTTMTGAGTVTAPTTTASGSFSAGSICRIGTQGDGRGGGQLYAISTHAATTLNLLTGMSVTPSNGDVLAPVVQHYFPEDATSSATNVTGLRFRYRSANLGLEFHGCYPIAVTLGGINPGEIPYWEITWAVSWWRYTATSGVSTVSSNQYNAAPIAAGSVVVTTVGGTSRSIRAVRAMSVTIDLGMVPLPGHGGASIYQKIIGAKRIPSKIRVKWTEDADAATATPALDSFYTSTNKYHLMFTGSVTNGSQIGFYLRNLNICGPRPIQVMNDNVNRLEIEAEANTSTTTTSELTLSAAVFASA